MNPIMLAATHHRTAAADNLVKDISITSLLRVYNFKYLGVLFSPRNDTHLEMISIYLDSSTPEMILNQFLELNDTE